MKKLLLFWCALCTVLSLAIPTWATVIDPGTGSMDSLGSTTESTESSEADVPEVSPLLNTDNGTETHILTGDELLPDATLDDVDDYIEDKGGQILHVVQKVAAYIDGVIFIVCFVLVVIGGFGNKQLAARGATGCLLCLIVFAAIYYAPALMEWFRQWAAPNV